MIGISRLNRAQVHKNINYLLEVFKNGMNEHSMTMIEDFPIFLEAMFVRGLL